MPFQFGASGHKPRVREDGLGPCFVAWREQLAVAGRSESDDDLVNRWRFGDPIAPAEYFLRQEVNRNLEEHISIVVPADVEGRFDYRPDCLLSAAYLQFAQEIQGLERPARVCSECGRFFTPTHGRQQYCDDNCRWRHGYRRKALAKTDHTGERNRKESLKVSTWGKRSRGNAEGSIYQRASDGRWVAAITLMNGRRRVLYGKTRADVSRKLNAALQAREQGIPIPPQRLTVGKLLDEWIERDVKQRPVTRTMESYDFLIRVHLKPVLSRKRVVDLTVRDVEDFLLAKAGERSALGRPYAASTLRSLRAVLSGALTYGQRLDLVHRNVARLARIPFVEPAKQRTAMTPELARVFLDKIQGHRLEALYSVAMAIGLRQAEALGLRWSDVDLDACVLHVRVPACPDQRPEPAEPAQASPGSDNPAACDGCLRASRASEATGRGATRS